MQIYFHHRILGGENIFEFIFTTEIFGGENIFKFIFTTIFFWEKIYLNLFFPGQYGKGRKIYFKKWLVAWLIFLLVWGDIVISIKRNDTRNLDRAPLKEVLGGQYTYREGEGKCCGRALIKAAG